MNLRFDKPLEKRLKTRLSWVLASFTKGGSWVLRAFGELRLTKGETWFDEPLEK